MRRIRLNWQKHLRSQATMLSARENSQTAVAVLFPFQRVALRILGERDPKLNLPPEERWKFTRDAERRPYSNIIREGVAETLSLLGSYPKALASCSTGKPESVSILTLRQLLENADWQ